MCTLLENFISKSWRKLHPPSCTKCCRPSGSRNKQVGYSYMIISLHWFPVKFYVDFKITLLTFKAVNGWHHRLTDTVCSQPMCVDGGLQVTPSSRLVTGGDPHWHCNFLLKTHFFILVFGGVGFVFDISLLFVLVIIVTTWSTDVRTFHSLLIWDVSMQCYLRFYDDVWIGFILLARLFITL